LRVGIDIGTQAIKVAMVSSSGAVTKTWKYRLYRSFRSSAVCEQDPAEWEELLLTCLDEVSKSADEAICPNCSTLLVYKKGNKLPSNAILWCDRSHLEHASRFLKENSKDSHQFSVEDIVLRAFSIVERFRNTSRIVELSTWANEFLTSQEFIADHIKKYRWGSLAIPPILISELSDGNSLSLVRDLISTPTKFIGELVGAITNREVQKLSPKLHNTGVYMGGNDGLISALGAGLLSDDEDTIYEICGTSHILITRNQKLPATSTVDLTVGLEDISVVIMAISNGYISVSNGETKYDMAVCDFIKLEGLERYSFKVMGGAIEDSITKFFSQRKSVNVCFLDEYCGAVGAANIPNLAS